MNLETLVDQIAKRVGNGDLEKLAERDREKLAGFVHNAVKIILEKAQPNTPKKISIDGAAFQIANTVKLGIHTEVEIIPIAGGKKVLALTFGGGRYSGRPDGYDKKTNGKDIPLVPRELFYVKDIKKAKKNMWVGVKRAIKDAENSDFRLDIQLNTL